ncbi:TetR/AcrR family transcriptional regulator [Paenibacillus thailandensis]|jgi:AcrR family transcriptional regulator|uniref:TetR/AcrR family transcriptional regulator n=1 Tax=Paenibacillus thailandensis TaxID=393250 RepID=A0ABW5R2Y6_9BACL
MPKIVDHSKRKEQIAEAVWRVVRLNGVDGASVRRVADELGMSLGSLRHYFDSQQELLAYAMRLLSEKVRQRIAALPFNGDPRHDIELVVLEFLPLDKQRLLEAEVWLAYAGKAVSDPAIREISRQVHGELYEAFRGMVERLQASGKLLPGLNANLETRRFHAFIDGLAVQLTTFPESFTAEEIKELVAYHLDKLAAAT